MSLVVSFVVLIGVLMTATHLLVDQCRALRQQRFCISDVFVLDSVVHMSQEEGTCWNISSEVDEILKARIVRGDPYQTHEVETVGRYIQHGGVISLHFLQGKVGGRWLQTLTSHALT